MIDVGGTTIVVSGFPRSGTSSMMRVLQFAGFDILAAERHLNAVAESDPHGILELENMAEFPNYTPEMTANKAVKIVAPYIKLLPLDRPVKVIFMLREIAEIVASLVVQRTIWEQDPYTWIDKARRYIESTGVPMLPVHYSELMKYPKSTIRRVSEFLGATIDIEAAARAVDNKPREAARFDTKKVIKFGKDALFQSREDILVMNDPSAESAYLGGE